MNYIKKISFGFSSLLILNTTQAYQDISQHDPQQDIINHLQEVNIMKGFGDGNFYPEKTITRAEALTVALRSGGIQIPSNFGGETFFADVDPNQWYAPVVARATELKITSSKNKNFRPNQAIGKAEFLAFLFRATKVDFGPHFGKTSNIALDIQKDAWFAPHFSYAKKYQIAHLPLDNFYRPFKTLSRREVAMMTYRQLKIFHGDGETKLLVELNAEIQQFLSLIRNDKNNEAEFHLHRILELNDLLTRTKNSSDAVAMKAISKSMQHLSDSLRFFRGNYNLAGIENLYLASKQAKLASKKSEKLAPFTKQLLGLIDETLINFTSPKKYTHLSQL